MKHYTDTDESGLVVHINVSLKSRSSVGACEQQSCHSTQQKIDKLNLTLRLEALVMYRSQRHRKSVSLHSILLWLECYMSDMLVIISRVSLCNYKVHILLFSARSAGAVACQGAALSSFKPGICSFALSSVVSRHNMLLLQSRESENVAAQYAPPRGAHTAIRWHWSNPHHGTIRKGTSAVSNADSIKLQFAPLKGPHIQEPGAWLEMTVTSSPDVYWSSVWKITVVVD